MNLDRLMSDCKQLTANNRPVHATGHGWAPGSVSVSVLGESCVSGTECQGRAPGAGALCSMLELQSQLFLSCLNTLFEEMDQIKCIFGAFYLKRLNSVFP